MKHQSKIVTTLAAALVAAQAAVGATINFDDLTFSGGRTNAPSHQYAAVGAMFNGTIPVANVCVVEPSFCTAFTSAGGTSPNALELDGAVGSLSIELTFLVPGTSLPAVTDSIQARFFDAEVGSTAGTIEAYAQDGRLLGSDTRITPSTNAVVLGVSAPGIARVRLSTDFDGAYVDNVTFTTPTGTTNACASLAIDLYAGISVEGTVGGAHRLQYVTNVADTNWSTLTNFVLPQSPYLIFDPDSPRWASRFYRVQCANAAGLVALGDALFDSTSDQFPTNSYRPWPAGVRIYQGYGNLAGYTNTETISYGESVAGVAAVRVHNLTTLPGDQGADFWYARDLRGDTHFLKSMGGGVVVWEASATVTPPLALPAAPILHHCWPSYADQESSVRDLNGAAQGFSSLLKVRVVGDDDSIGYNFYQLGVGRVVIQTSKDPSPTGSGWKFTSP